MRHTERHLALVERELPGREEGALGARGEGCPRAPRPARRQGGRHVLLAPPPPGLPWRAQARKTCDGGGRWRHGFPLGPPRGGRDSLAQERP